MPDEYVVGDPEHEPSINSDAYGVQEKLLFDYAGFYH